MFKQAEREKSRSRISVYCFCQIQFKTESERDMTAVSRVKTALFSLIKMHFYLKLKHTSGLYFYGCFPQEFH